MCTSISSTTRKHERRDGDIPLLHPLWYRWQCNRSVPLCQHSADSKCFFGAGFGCLELSWDLMRPSRLKVTAVCRVTDLYRGRTNTLIPKSCIRLSDSWETLTEGTGCPGTAVQTDSHRHSQVSTWGCCEGSRVRAAGRDFYILPTPPCPILTSTLLPQILVTLHMNTRAKERKGECRKDFNMKNTVVFKL